MDRIYTGFESLDKHLKIYKGDLVVVGGRIAIGKTCFLCSIIERTINKQKIIFFSMQTNKLKALNRLNTLNVVENENDNTAGLINDYGAISN
jgi:replicative DNA helicase